MGDSILLSIKKLLGIGDDYKYFDEDIIMHINSVFMILEALRTYVYMRVRLMFDPPSSSFVLTSFENQYKELEWRLNVMVDPKS